MDITIVDSLATMIALLDCIQGLPVRRPSLYLDIEGVNLSRNGSISIIQLFVEPRNNIFLIDIHILQEQAFDTPNRSGATLRSVLESEVVLKAFFDVRNDADALFSHSQISSRCIHDLQLLEVATRRWNKKRVMGLAACIDKDTQLTTETKREWKATKKAGRALFSPEHGGSYEIFNKRPKPEEIVDYCTQDVIYLPMLWSFYSNRLEKKWVARVQNETTMRLLMSQSAFYDPDGKDKIFSPWGHGVKPIPADRPKDTEDISARLPEKSHQSYVQPTGTKAAPKSSRKTQGAIPKPQAPGPYIAAQIQQEAAGSQAKEKAVEAHAGLTHPITAANLSIRAKPAIEPLATYRTSALAEIWSCSICNREMQSGQMQDHLAGKSHINRSNSAQQAELKRVGPSRAAKGNDKRPQQGPGLAVVSTGTDVRSKTRSQRKNLQHAGSMATKDRKTSPANAILRQAGNLYPPEHGFIGFSGSFAPQSYGQLAGSCIGDEDRNFGSEDYGICDKDCGWCGHCMDGIDV